jgi:hypothetical protein
MAHCPDLVKALLLLACSAVPAWAGTLPHFDLETLSGKPVSLPEAGRGRVTLLIVGFSRASQGPTGAWRGRFDGDFGKDPRYAMYQIAVLERVPRLIRGMVVGGMKKSIPPGRQDKLLVVFHDAEKWKEVMGFAAPDDAYVALLDPNGKVTWRRHGPFRDSDYAELREQARVIGGK